METNKLPENKFLTRSKAIAEHIVRNLYRKKLSMETFFCKYAARDFSWVSTGEMEFFRTVQEAREHFLEQIMEMPQLNIYEDIYLPSLLSEDICLVLAQFWIETREEDRCVLREHQRASLLFRRDDGEAVKVVHMHFSNPWWPMRESKKWPTELGRFSYEYLMEKIVDCKHFCPNLTMQQRKILYLLSQGMTYREVGELIGVTQRTVRYHVMSLMDKFSVQTKSQLIAAAEQGKAKLVADGIGDRGNLPENGVGIKGKR